jgi:hypothetical protein
MKRPAAVLLAVGAAAAALLPLYGEIRSTALTHPEWARLLLRAIHNTDVTEQSATASQVFNLLSWRESLTYPAERYYAADRVEMGSDASASCVKGRGEVGEVSYRLAVIRGGRYRFRARVRGSGATVVEEIGSLADAKPIANFRMAPNADMEWIEAGQHRLSPGSYVASLHVPADACVSHIEVVPPCLPPIEPVGGWKPRAVTQASDVAVTVLKAIELESELPPAAAALERAGSDFLVDESTGQPQALPVAGGPEAAWLRGGVAGTRALLVVTVPEDGLYNLAVLGRFKNAQRWGLDSCFENVLCPLNDEGLRWRSIATTTFVAGRHVLSVELAPQAVVARVKVERKKDSADDYRATLARLGFDVGAEGPITRKRAGGAADWMKGRGSLSETGRCTDVVFNEPELTRVAGNGLQQPVQQPPVTNRNPPITGDAPVPLQPPGVDPAPNPGGTATPPPVVQQATDTPAPSATPSATPPSTPTTVLPTPPPTPTFTPTATPTAVLPPPSPTATITPVPTQPCGSPPCP